MELFFSWVWKFLLIFDMMVVVNFFVVMISMNRRELKQKAKKNFKQNYWKCFWVCFIVLLLTGGTLINTYRDVKEFDSHSIQTLNSLEGKSNSEIVNEFVQGVTHAEVSISNNDGVIGNVVDNVTKSGSFVFGILNALNQFLFQDHIFAGIIIVIGIFLGVFYWIFIAKVVEVGRCRFFLENRLYSKTKMGRIIHPYRVFKSINVSLAMLQRSIYQFLWCLTIVGGPIQFYSYRMVPYLLAEDPSLKGKEAIQKSKQMMKGHRFELFLLDCSFLFHIILGILTLNLFNLFYTNLYMEATCAEYYMYLRKLWKDKISFPDQYLENNSEELIEYPEQCYFLPHHESRNILKRLDYNQKYSISSYLLFFFAFSFLGWIWEVSLTLFSEGVFVNRGVYYGPWLPIYGSGGVLILFCLQKFRDRPGFTFFLIMLLCGILEYGTAFYLETFKGMKWWDYTGYFLNLHGRICLEGLLFFGIGGLAFIYFLAPFLNHYFKKWTSKFCNLLCLSLLLIFFCDFVYCSIHPNQGDGITSSIVSSENG